MLCSTGNSSRVAVSDPVTGCTRSCAAERHSSTGYSWIYTAVLCTVCMCTAHHNPYAECSANYYEKIASPSSTSCFSAMHHLIKVQNVYIIFHIGDPVDRLSFRLERVMAHMGAYSSILRTDYCTTRAASLTSHSHTLGLASSPLPCAPRRTCLCGGT